MQTSSQPKLLPVPFADGGSKETIPVASQIGITAGRASYTDGFPPLTRTPLAAGGVPPFGTDFNGVLNDITAAIRWKQSGAGYNFDSTFSATISGYPKGAKLTNSTFDGFWLNTVDGNTSAPEAADASLTGWVPSESYGVTNITGLSGTSIALSSLQASKDRITLSGTLTSNIIITLPAWIKKWTVLNNCSGAFSVTMKTPNGTGTAIPSGTNAIIQGDGVNIFPATNPGALINTQVLTASGTYTPTLGTKKIIVEIIGGGGGSGGLGGTGTNQVVISAGGGSGTYAQVLISNPSQTSVTVGTGGAGGLGQNGATGGRGGSSVFGAFVTVEGGFGSSVGLSKAMPAHGIPTSVSPQFTYANCSLMTFSYGGAGTPGFVTANGDAVAGAGGTSFFGLGGDGSGNKGTGKPGMSPGSGGGGVCVSDSSYGQTTTGARGADGICVIWEYS
jgi:hypothetical protein